MSKVHDGILEQLVRDYHQEDIRAVFMPKGSDAPGGVACIRVEGRTVCYVQVKLSLGGSRESTGVTEYSGTVGGVHIGTDEIRSASSSDPKFGRRQKLSTEKYEGNCQCVYLIKGFHMDKKASKTRLKVKGRDLVWKGALARPLNADDDLIFELSRSGVKNVVFKYDPKTDCTAIIHKQPIFAKVETEETDYGTTADTRLMGPTARQLLAVDQLASKVMYL